MPDRKHKILCFSQFIFVSVILGLLCSSVYYQCHVVTGIILSWKPSQSTVTLCKARSRTAQPSSCKSDCNCCCHTTAATYPFSSFDVVHQLLPVLFLLVIATERLCTGSWPIMHCTTRHDVLHRHYGILFH